MSEADADARLSTAKSRQPAKKVNRPKLTFRLSLLR